MLIGADSEYYRIEQQLTEQGWERRAHETAQDWMVRLNSDAKLDTILLAEIVELHNRYRLDPLGLSDAQRAQLSQTAGVWLRTTVPVHN